MAVSGVFRTSMLLAAVVLATALMVLANLAAKPARAQIEPPRAILVGAGDIAGCGYDRDYYTAKLVDRIITDSDTAGVPKRIYTLGDNAYPEGTNAQFRNCYDPTWGGSHLGARDDITPKVVNPQMYTLTKPAPGNHEYLTTGAWPYFYSRSAARPGFCAGS